MSKMNKDKGPHQAKNKPSDASKEKDFEVVEQNSADERKTVIVDNDFENLEFDDKVWLWWKNNKLSVIAAVIASLAIIVIVNGKKMIDANALASAQVAYNQCSDEASLESFVKDYAYSELAGIAALQLADTQYGAGNFEKSKELYSKALKSLKTNEVAPRAALGVAFSEIKLGDNAAAKETLKGLSQVEGLNAAYKAQATFQLGVLEFSNGDKALAKTLIETVAHNPLAGIWANQAQLFIRSNY